MKTVRRRIKRRANRKANSENVMSGTATMKPKGVRVGMTKQSAKIAYQQYLQNGGDLSFADWLNTTQTGASLPANLAVRAKRRSKRRLRKRFATFVYADGTTEDAEIEEDLDDDEDGLGLKLKEFSDKQILGMSVGALLFGFLAGVGTYHLWTKND